jgi:hypothetical protein
MRGSQIQPEGKLKNCHGITVITVKRLLIKGRHFYRIHQAESGAGILEHSVEASKPSKNRVVVPARQANVHRLADRYRRQLGF